MAKPMNLLAGVLIPIAALAEVAWAGTLASYAPMVVLLGTSPAAASDGEVSADEKAKALANPYANDLGPDTLPAQLIASYPAPIQEGYDLLVKKCSACHKSARPLNSQFVDADTWKRYVKRMMGKGCALSPGQAKSIWNFLVYDSKERKTGEHEAEWAAHRTRLLAEFKEKFPARYEELYGKNATSNGGG